MTLGGTAPTRRSNARDGITALIQPVKKYRYRSIPRRAAKTAAPAPPSPSTAGLRTGRAEVAPSEGRVCGRRGRARSGRRCRARPSRGTARTGDPRVRGQLSTAAPYCSRVADDWTPQYRLEKAREREHVVVAIVRAQTEWRDILEVVEAAASPDAAQKALRTSFGFSREQATAVMDTQFRRVSYQDRTRIADELAALRAEIAGLEGDQ